LSSSSLKRKSKRIESEEDSTLYLYCRESYCDSREVFCSAGFAFSQFSGLIILVLVMTKNE
jgi:hypothetical protein